MVPPFMKTGFHIDEIYVRHRTPEGHPERAGRIERLLDLAERGADLGVTVIPARRQATEAEIALVHTRDHVAAIASTAGKRASILDPDTFTSADSYETARYAAGGVLDLVDRVASGELDNAFAAVRPPGHHAESDRSMGFCLFNNIAVAAAYALERHGLERVLVVDWDVHHGNGTQEIFWEDPRVLFISLHQFPFYPGTGAAHETGGGAGTGFTLNVPMTAGFGNAEYLAAFRQVVGPVARAFRPQFVLVSAGFDAHERDPLGGMRVTEAGFDGMAAEVLAVARECAGGRCIAVLEGGYDLEALSGSVERVLRRMNASTAGSPTETIPEGGRFESVLEHVKSAHETRWPL